MAKNLGPGVLLVDIWNSAEEDSFLVPSPSYHPLLTVTLRLSPNPIGHPSTHQPFPSDWSPKFFIIDLQLH